MILGNPQRRGDDSFRCDRNATAEAVVEGVFYCARKANRPHMDARSVEVTLASAAPTRQAVRLPADRADQSAPPPMPTAPWPYQLISLPPAAQTAWPVSWLVLGAAARAPDQPLIVPCDTNDVTGSADVPLPDDHGLVARTALVRELTLQPDDAPPVLGHVSRDALAQVIARANNASVPAALRERNGHDDRDPAYLGWVRELAAAFPSHTRAAQVDDVHAVAEAGAPELTTIRVAADRSALPRAASGGALPPAVTARFHLDLDLPGGGTLQRRMSPQGLLRLHFEGGKRAAAVVHGERRCAPGPFGFELLVAANELARATSATIDVLHEDGSILHANFDQESP